MSTPMTWPGCNTKLVRDIDVDIVVRLRHHALPDPHDEREVLHAPLLKEAANEIDRLRAEVASLRESVAAKDGEIASLKKERDAMRRKIFTNTNGEFSLEKRTFSIEGFDFILDNNFDFDAGFSVSGDFGGDDKRQDYMQMICNALNSHFALTQQLAAAKVELGINAEQYEKDSQQIHKLGMQLAAIQLYSKGLREALELVKDSGLLVGSFNIHEIANEKVSAALSAPAPDLSALDGYVKDAAVAEIYQDSNTLLPALRFTVGIGYFAKTAINNPIPLYAAIQANAEKKGE